MVCQYFYSYFLKTIVHVSSLSQLVPCDRNNLTKFYQNSFLLLFNYMPIVIKKLLELYFILDASISIIILMNNSKYFAICIGD
jgi:hypothetical protein